MISFLIPVLCIAAGLCFLADVATRRIPIFLSPAYCGRLLVRLLVRVTGRLRRSDLLKRIEYAILSFLAITAELTQLLVEEEETVTAEIKETVHLRKICILT